MTPMDEGLDFLIPTEYFSYAIWVELFRRVIFPLLLALGIAMILWLILCLSRRYVIALVLACHDKKEAGK